MRAQLKTRRPPMTAAEAKSFGRISAGNMRICRAHFQCDCDPYEDIYPFKRWQALGYHVNRGEKGLRLSIIKHVIDEELETETKLFTSAFVFCRCQVTEKENSEQ